MRITLEGDHSLVVTEIGEPGMEVETAPQVHAHFTSFEMFATSVGLCTASVLAAYGEQLDVETEGLAVRVRWTVAEKPRRIGELSLDFAWPELPASRRRAAERAAAHCPLHKTLENPPKLVTRVHAGEEAAALLAEVPQPDGHWHGHGHSHDREDHAQGHGHSHGH